MQNCPDFEIFLAIAIDVDNGHTCMHVCAAKFKTGKSGRTVARKGNIPQG